MYWTELAAQSISIALEISIIVLLLRADSRKFPFFSGYLVFILLRTLVGSVALSNPSFYFYFYWISAPVEIVLTVLAVLESFWRVFRSFQLLLWFRFVLPGAIASALAYSAWRGYRMPPVQATPTGAAIIHAIVTSHYVIVTVALLFLLLAAFLGVSLQLYEHRITLGFGVASLAVAFGGTVRIAFGPVSDFVSREAQPLGYLVALLIWLSAAIHPVPEQPVFQTLSDVQVKELVENLRIQLRSLSSFVRKGRL